MINFYDSNELLELKKKGTRIEIKNDEKQESLKQQNYYYEQGRKEFGTVNDIIITSLKVEKMDKEVIEKMKKYIQENNASKEQVYEQFDGTYNKEYMYNLIIEKKLI